LNDTTKALVKSDLLAAGCTITSEGVITSEQIDKEGLIDQHYYAIASKATKVKPEDLNVPEDEFQKTFGMSYKDALAQKMVRVATIGVLKCD
jgi:hypothetical protein